MRLYDYRWWMASFITLLIGVVGYEFDLKILLRDAANLEARELRLHQQLSHPVIGSSPVTTVHSRLLQQFVLLVASQQIEIHSLIKIDGDGLGQSEYYKVALRGSYVALMGLLNQLSRVAGGYEFGSLAISQLKPRLLDVELLLHLTDPETVENVSPVEVGNMPSPFCTEDIISRLAPPDITYRYPLTQLRLLGVVQHNGLRDAMIAFPDGNNQIVLLGAALGSEGGHVFAIGMDGIIVEMPNKTQQFLRKIN